MSEADEAAKGSADQALVNLYYQVKAGETMGIIGMYELAALRAGASVRDVNRTMERAREDRKSEEKP